MGKNKKQKSTKQSKHADTQANKDTQPVDVPQEPQPTPEEKAKSYKDMQMQIFTNFLKDFQDEEKNLLVEPNFVDKQKDIEKREKEEHRKLEKLFKKDQVEVEEPYSNGNAKALRDRIGKTIQEIQKQQKQLTKVQASHTQTEQ